MIRYDERGCGLSERDVDEISFETWVHDLEAVVDAAGLDRFVLLEGKNHLLLENEPAWGQFMAEVKAFLDS